MFKTLSYFESLKLIFRWILYYDKKLAILFFFQTTHEKWLNDYENLDNNNDNNNDDDNDVVVVNEDDINNIRWC